MRKVRTEWRAFWAAVMAFTRVPTPVFADYEKDDLPRAAAYLPLVGWFVGGVGAGVWWSATRVFPRSVASGLSLAATILLTGAFHEDGWADLCDGFGGGNSKERVLEIMRDSRVGAFGVIGVVLMLGLKWQAIAGLPWVLTPQVIVAGHALSRGVAASLMSTLAYADDTGKAKPMVTSLRGGRLGVAMIFALAPLFLLPVRFWWGLLAVLIVRILFARWLVHRIGGYTGDCLGAAQQLSELAFLMTILALA